MEWSGWSHDRVLGGVSGWLGSCPWGLVLRAARCPCAGGLAGVGDGAPVRKHEINWGWGEGSEEVGERASFYAKSQARAKLKMKTDAKLSHSLIFYASAETRD